jgi:hypothetical protein
MEEALAECPNIKPRTLEWLLKVCAIGWGTERLCKMDLEGSMYFLWKIKSGL